MVERSSAPWSPASRSRLYEQVAAQIIESAAASGLGPGDKLPPERELARRLQVSRATLSQALVALEVIGVVTVRHGDGTILNSAQPSSRLDEAIRAHASRIPDVIDTRDALETKIAALAAARRTDDDMRQIDEALDQMQADIDGGGRGDKGDELFHAAITNAAHSPLLAQLMSEIADLIRETRIESLSQPGRPVDSMRGHRRIADAIRAGDSQAAARAMHEHIELVSDVAIVRS